MKKFFAVIALFAIGLFFGSNKKNEQVSVQPSASDSLGTNIAHADKPPPDPDGGDGGSDD